MINFDLNYFAVLTAGIVSVILGMIWYGPLFGKQWMRLMGFNSKNMKNMKMKPITSMILGLITSIVTAFVLALVLSSFAVESMMNGIGVGILVWFGFFATTMLGAVLWENKSFSLYFINALYQLVSLILMSIILTLWS